jgi:small-conductance mechanosensitive channel
MLTSSVGVAYGSDLQTLASRLVAAVAAVPRVLADPPPDLQLSAFGVSALELTIAFWIGDAQHGQANVRSLVNLAILRTLGEAGVEIRGTGKPSALSPRPET